LILEAPDTATVFARTRSNFAVVHLLSAASFSRRVGDLEKEHRGETFGAFCEEILAYASATIFATVAGLEAYANELFVDHATTFPELRLEVMAKLWELYEQKSSLEKYEFALLLKGAPAFERGHAPYQDVFALIKLRNGLTHFKPEWSDERAEHAKISAILASRQIVSSEFYPAAEALFPRGWANHFCTAWAVRSVAAFIDAFERQTKLPPKMKPFQERLRAV
jgi:hypothetical protein